MIDMKDFKMSEELIAKIEEFKAKQMESKELSPEELNSVSGGDIRNEDYYHTLVNMTNPADVEYWGDYFRALAAEYKHSEHLGYQATLNKIYRTFIEIGIKIVGIEYFITENDFKNL